jgi:hypothetical protein
MYFYQQLIGNIDFCCFKIRRQNLRSLGPSPHFQGSQSSALTPHTRFVLYFRPVTNLARMENIKKNSQHLKNRLKEKVTQKMTY